MTTLQIGQIYQPVVGRGEGAIFDIDAAGAKLIYHFYRPTAKELAAVKAGEKFEIRFVELDGLLWILSKCGPLNWADSPYDPHLSLTVEEFPVLEQPDQGLALTLMVTDAETAEIRSLRMIGLGHKFSAALLDRAKALRGQPFSLDAYRTSLQTTMARYTTNQLADIAGDYFKLKG